MTDQHSDETDKRMFIDRMVSIDKISYNVDQAVIVTTEDKLRIAFDGYGKRVWCRKNWIAPLTLLITIITVLVTATFNDFILNAAAWRIIFIMGALAAVAWLIGALWGLRQNVSVDQLIEMIRTGTQSASVKRLEGPK